MIRLFFLAALHFFFIIAMLGEDCVSTKGAEGADHIIALKRAGDLFFVEAKVDGTFGNFILDSGCEGLVMNEVYFRPSSTDSSRIAASMNGTTSHVPMTTVGQIQIADMEFWNLKADVTDLSTIENQKGLKIYGLLNLSFFDGFVYDLDLPNHLLTLRNKNFLIPREGALLDIPLKINEGIASFKAEVNDVRLRFSIDTGAELNVLHNALANEVYQGMTILRTSDLISSDGSRNQVLLAKINNLSIDGQAYDEMLTFVLDMVHMRSVQGKDLDGTLGFPFLSQGRFIIDPHRKRLYMFPSSSTE